MATTTTTSDRASASTPITSLPTELAVHCLKTLTIKDLLTVRRVCKSVNAWASDDSLWTPGKWQRCGKIIEPSSGSCFHRTCLAHRECAECAHAAAMVLQQPQRFVIKHYMIVMERSVSEQRWIFPRPYDEASVAELNRTLIVLWPTRHGPRWWVRKEPLRSDEYKNTHERSWAARKMLKDGDNAEEWTALEPITEEAAASSSSAEQLIKQRFSISPSSWHSFERWLSKVAGTNDWTRNPRPQLQNANAYHAHTQVLHSGDIAIAFNGACLIPDEDYPVDWMYSRAAVDSLVSAIHLPSGDVYHQEGGAGAVRTSSSSEFGPISGPHSVFGYYA